jgi:lysophospholipase L1-like esterase
VKLTQATLADHFSIADSNSSWYTEPTNTYDFADRNSNTLVVTIGDSWTWGNDMGTATHLIRGTDYAETSAHKEINAHRLNNCYGNVVAQALAADWLNLSISAVSNFWIAERAEELARIVPELEYNRIVVVCTFSGVGRWFNTRYDQHIDYVSWFLTHPDFDQLFAMLNTECVQRIVQALDQDHVQVVVGTTWADACGFDCLQPKQRLTRPWYELLDCGTSPPAYFCHYHERLSAATEFIPAVLHAKFKQWFIDTVDCTEQRLQLLTDPAKFRNTHPGPAGHRLWADYILEHLCAYT